MVRTHSAASNFTGLNLATTSRLYSSSGIFLMRIKCSAYPRTACPFHSPPGPEYTPQCMKHPNRATRHHATLCSRVLIDSVHHPPTASATAASSRETLVCAETKAAVANPCKKVRLNMSPYCNLRALSPPLLRSLRNKTHGPKLRVKPRFLSPFAVILFQMRE